MTSNLKADIKTAFTKASSKEGIPPVIDKTINSVYEEFKKSQPLKLAEKGLNDAWKDKVEVWTNLENSMKKFGVHEKIIKHAMKTLKGIYGENPSETEVRLMVT